LSGSCGIRGGRGAYAPDGSKSALFTLKNRAGVEPTKFPKKGNDSWAAFLKHDACWYFGDAEGPCVFSGGDARGGPGFFCEDVVGQGQAIFNGGQDFFRLAR
jgi:hypothetical protein